MTATSAGWNIWKGVGGGEITLHHAYCLVGNRSRVLDELFSFFKEALRFETRRNPDFYLTQVDMLTIDESRRIKEVQSKKPVGPRKIIILAFNSATGEAQNALLRVFEEPSADTHFFLIVPRRTVLLPTLLSRLFVIESGVELSREAVVLAKEFLESTPGERVKIAKRIADEISEGVREKQFAIEVVESLEKIFWDARGEGSLAPEVFEDLSLCRKYLADRSASTKMLLEHLALVLPLAPSI